MTSPTDPLYLSPALKIRLENLAAQSGLSFRDLAEAVLSAHADEQERRQAEFTEDDARWQRYIEDGQAIPFETIRNKLHGLAAQAAQKVEPQ
jgi:predicted transcriptional regulator